MNKFKFLQERILDQTKIDIVDDMHPLYKRFFQSFNQNFHDRSLLDIAILLRQILLLETRERKNNYATLNIPQNEYWPEEKHWQEVGIHYVVNEGMWNISAEFWKPDWLTETQNGVDYNASSDLNKKDEIHFTSNATDIFLKSCGEMYSKYTSIDQQKAIRSTLSLNQGKTLVISLPTGEGKSLVFKSINKVGFFDTKNKGLTLVIVPTVTLALDQEKGIQKEYNSTEPYAYIGQRETENKIIKERIKSGEQDICFVSPEAVYGSLRQSLIQAAKNGHIKAIVIDEAHIIEEWGDSFRNEYQLFSGLWRQLLEISPITNQFRTVLLSATFTQESINLIDALFTKDNELLEVYSATKLRPEIDYWIADVVNDESIREKMILESVRHLPRPLILYTTEVKDSIKYFSLLKDIGLKNISLIHGQSSSKERNDVIEQWKLGRLDVVVATSAFGLGIDYQHTRSIVHACIPETLNRFYQEVGRGGRDGKSSVSLLIPTKKDLSTAQNMNRKKLISDYDKAFDRWQTMFNNKKMLDDKDAYIIDLGQAPSRNIDFDTKGHNRNWNTQVILIMARAKLLQLVGIPSIEFENDTFEDYSRYITIRILNEEHYNKDTWIKNIDKLLLSSKNTNKFSLDLLFMFMKQTLCPADIISQLYRFSYAQKNYDLSLICSSCQKCRGGEKQYIYAPLNRAYPLSGDISKSVFNIFSSKSILVEYEKNFFEERLYKRSFYKVMNEFITNGIQNIICIGDSFELFFSDKTLSKVENKPIYFETITKLRDFVRAKKRLPNKAYIIFIGNDIKIDGSISVILEQDNSIVFLPKNTVDPNTPTRLVSEVYPNEMFTIDELISKVGI